MFSSRDVWMVIKKATLTIAEDDKGVEHRMAEVSLVLDPFPIELARQLGDDVAGHVYADDGALRQEVSTIALDPRVPPQRMSATGAVGHEGTEIRNVEVLGLTVAKQQDDKSGKVWFRATFKVRFDLAPKINREWLVRCFGLGMAFSFDAEQLDMLTVTDVVERAVTNPGQEFVDKMRAMGSDVEISTVKNGRRVGTRITKDKVEAVDHPNA